MGLAIHYHNNYLKPTSYNLQQIIYMTAILVFFIYIWREQKGESRMELFTLSSTSVMYEFIEMYRKVMYNQTTLSLQKMKQQTKCYNVIVDIHAMNIGTAFICRV